MESLLLRNRFYKKWIIRLFVILTFPSILQWLNYELGNTTIWWFFETLFLLLSGLYSLSSYSIECYYLNLRKKKLIALCALSYSRKKYKHFLLSFLLLIKTVKNKAKRIVIPIPIVIYILYIALSIIHGCFKASYYWDWKILYSNIMFYLIPISFYFFSIPSNLKQASRSWILFAMIAFWVLLPIMQMECPARFLFPFAFFIIFWPYYNKKGKIICAIAFACVFAFGSLGARSSAIRFLASFGLSLLIILQKYVRKSFLVIISSILILTPIVFLVLGITGEFNIFKLGDYINLDYSVDNSMIEGETENLSADTRTFLYVETLSSAIEHDYVLLGNSLSQGYYAHYFAEWDEVKGRGMRYSTEVCILNIFTNLGLIGVILYFAIFVYTIINVFKNSNNYPLLIIAVLLSFRWMISFIEEFTRFDLNTVFLWIEIAICNSPYFLRMTDKQFKNWAKNLLMK